jgi:hypothetical protein
MSENSIVCGQTHYNVLSFLAFALVLTRVQITTQSNHEACTDAIDHEG